MTRLVILFACVAIPACSPPPGDAEAFAQAPESAARVVADCDAGRRRHDCVAARQGLAETRRRERMTAYARTIREP